MVQILKMDKMVVFLSLITFGIYIFWVIPSLNKWVVEHTDYDDLN